MVKLRLKRMGKKGAPFYRIVAADSRSPRDGRFIEQIGTYNPTKAEEKVKRGEGLYKADKMKSISRSDDNPLMDSLYAGILALTSPSHMIGNSPYPQGNPETRYDFEGLKALR